METNEIAERIAAVADQLFEENGREKFPTVDEVRRKAKSDMNTASLVMRRWRKKQMAPAEVVPIVVPDGVQAAFQEAIVEAWSQAQALANEKLDAARQAFEAEKLEEEVLRKEISEAFEVQSIELAQITSAHERSLVGLDEANRKIEKQLLQIADLESKLTQALTKIEMLQDAEEDLTKERETRIIIEKELALINLERENLKQENITMTDELHKKQALQEKLKDELNQQRQASALANSKVEQLNQEVERMNRDLEKEKIQAKEILATRIEAEKALAVSQSQLSECRVALKNN